MSTPAPSSQLDKKKSLILGAVGLFFIVIIFWKVIPQIGSYSEAWDALKSMSVAAIVAVVVSVLVSHAMAAIYAVSPFGPAEPYIAKDGWIGTYAARLRVGHD